MIVDVGSRSYVCSRRVHVLRFTVAETSYAVGLDRIVEVAPRVLMTPLPGAPPFVEGVLSYRQSVCVAVSLRRRLGHPARAASLDEHILVVRGRRRLLGFVVDRAESDEIVDDARVEAPAEGTRHLKGVVALADGVLLIQDVDAMLTDAEEDALDASLGEAPSS